MGIPPVCVASLSSIVQTAPASSVTEPSLGKNQVSFCMPVHAHVQVCMIIRNEFACKSSYFLNVSSQEGQVCGQMNKSVAFGIDPSP